MQGIQYIRKYNNVGWEMAEFLIFHWDGCISAGHRNAQKYDNTVNDEDYPEILNENHIFRFSD